MGNCGRQNNKGFNSYIPPVATQQFKWPILSQTSTEGSGKNKKS